MSIELLARGALIGLSIAAPVGPIGALCIRKTLAEGRMSGLFTGLGAAAADGVYGALSVTGLSVLSSALMSSSLLLRVGGGAFLCYLGFKTLVSPVRASGDAVTDEGRLNGWSHAKSFLNTFLVTLSNPMTILCFAAVFAGLGATRCSVTGGIAVVAGVFLGSCAWWLFLTAAVASLRARLSPQAMRTINVVSGGVVIAFGAGALVSAVRL